MYKAFINEIGNIQIRCTSDFVLPLENINVWDEKIKEEVVRKVSIGDEAYVIDTYEFKIFNGEEWVVL